MTPEEFVPVSRRIRGFLHKRTFNVRLVLGRLYYPLNPTVTLSGIKVRIDQDFSPEMIAAIRGRYYEAEELRMLESRLTPSDVVLEIGAGLGVVAAYCARRIGSDRVYTYEANPRLEPHIRRIFTLNKVHPHLEVCMIGESDGVGDFYISDDFWSSAPLSREDKVLRRTRVTSRSFNDVVHRIRPTFLIVDIEGGEYDLCRYGDFHGILKVLIEIHAWIIGADQAHAVLTRLRRAGFRPNGEADGGRVVFLERIGT